MRFQRRVIRIEAHKLSVVRIKSWSACVVAVAVCWIVMIHSGTCRADVAIAIGEAKARMRFDNLYGKGMRQLYDIATNSPGHSALFVSDLCLDASHFKVRMCGETDRNKGVYISFIEGLSSNEKGEQYAWIAVERNVFLYGVQQKENTPVYYATFKSDLTGKLRSLPGKRKSSLDASRYSFLTPGLGPATDGSTTRSDKVHIGYLAERDVYEITVRCNTREQARKLLDYFNRVANKINPAPGTNEEVEGTFGWRNSCAAKNDWWMSVMFGEEVRVGYNLTTWIGEFGVLSPREYARRVQGKLERLIKKEKLPLTVDWTFYPKIAGDHDRSLGFSSPATNVHNPFRPHLGIPWLVSGLIGKGTYIATLQTLFQLPNLFFNADREYRKSNRELIRVRKELEAVARPQEVKSRRELERALRTAADSHFGTEKDWRSAQNSLKERFAALMRDPSLPTELRWMIANRTKKRGDFSNHVSTLMAKRSNAEMINDVHYLSFRFHQIAGQGNKAMEPSNAEELPSHRTGVSADTITRGDRPLALMLMLAAVDNYLGEKPQNRPAWNDMQRNMRLLDQVAAGASAQADTRVSGPSPTAR